MVHYFGPPIDLRKAPKRKRADDTPESPSHNQQFPVHNPLHETDDLEDEDEHVNTPKDFPHAPLPVQRDASERPAVTKQQRNVKRQHFIVLNTILHKCLLDQDFVRAGRAFGLLLRLEMAGKRINLRQKGLWGIGAEILLHQRLPRAMNDTSNIYAIHDDDIGDGEDSHTVAHDMFTINGFRAARQYYERLILQYPYKKTRPQDISSQHFYPAMFGLWIFEAQSQSQKAQKKTNRRQNSQSSSHNSTPTSNESQEPPTEDLEAPKVQELEQARAIAARLDEVTFLPPFDQDAQLLKLKGMVGLWIADLIAATSSDSQLDVDSQRRMAREHLQRAKAHGWKGMDGFGRVLEEEEEEEMGHSTE